MAINVDLSGNNTCLDPDDDTRYIYHQDANYNVVALTACPADPNDAPAVVEHIEYDPYGAMRIHRGQDPADSQYRDSWTVVSQSTIGNPLTYTGYRVRAMSPQPDAGPTAAA